MKRFILIFSLAISIFPVAARAADKRPMTVDDLFRFQRVADPQISPDGKTVAYVMTTVDLPGNKSSSSIWLASAQNGKPRALTNTTKKDGHPRWSPNGQRILFESNRSGKNQLWIINVNGGEASQLTTISSEAGNALWSPDGKWIAFVSAVYPEYSDKPFSESDALNKKRKEEAEKNPVKAKVFTKLFFRHWNEWVEDKRQHLFVMEVKPEPHGMTFVGLPRDVTPGDRDANPTSDTFAVGDDFTFSPDSKYLLYTAPPARNEAWSTNYDICRVPVAGGPMECLTKDNPAADGAPKFSPDGKWLAYRAQQKPGFESDRWQIMVMPADMKEKPVSITAETDLSAGEFVWWPTSAFGPLGGVAFTAERHARTKLFQTGVNSRGGSVGQFLLGDSIGTLSSVSVSQDGETFAAINVNMQQPAEVVVFRLGEVVPTGHAQGDIKTHLRNVSQANTNLLAGLDLPRPESVTVPGAGGTPMQMWILKPPGFDPKKKWPLAFLVHGGPQGAWEDGWSYRWNPELWAAQGYVVALPSARQHRLRTEIRR